VSNTKGAENRGGAAAVIPGYIIAERLGGGGGGVVYRAFREGSDRPLALKVLSVPVGEGFAAKRAWRELDVLESLRLPVVPRLIDYGVHEGRMFIAAEFVEGRPLSTFGAADRRDVRACVELLAKIAEAVQMLHEHGVIHRDIKPSNVIVTPRGDVMIIDMGLAMLLADDPVRTMTAEGNPLGTPAYMSPEQARGERSRISTRSDVYGLGATAYWLLTGSTPHDCDCSLHEAVRRVAQEEGREAKTLREDLPKALGAVLGKACAKEGEKRYESAGAMGEDLRRWGRGEAVHAGSLGLWKSVSRWAAARPVTATICVCGLLAFAILSSTTATAWWMAAAPHDLVIENADRSAISIVSRSGAPLYTWRAAGAGGVSRDPLLLADPTNPGERLIVIGLSESAGIEGAGEVTVYTFTAPPKVLWRSGTSPPDIHLPRPTAWNRSESFQAQLISSGNVFGTVHDEVIATHRHTLNSPTAIRVYDVRSGLVLYEAWHDGELFDIAWLEPERVLIGVAVNSEVPGPERVHQPPLTRHPTVVFALRPTRDREPAWIQTPSWSGMVAPAWYRAVMPSNRLPGGSPPIKWNRARFIARSPDDRRRGEIRISLEYDGDSPASKGYSPARITLRAVDGSAVRIDPTDDGHRELGAGVEDCIEVTDLPPWAPGTTNMTPR
jgi:predicted Ser/Thr protein kinase